jgi:hypothetical protein
MSASKMSLPKRSPLSDLCSSPTSSSRVVHHSPHISFVFDSNIFPYTLSFIFRLPQQFEVSWGSSVSTVSYYRLDDMGSIPGSGKGFSPLASCVQTSSQAHPASFQMSTGGKARPGRDAEACRINCGT